MSFSTAHNDYLDPDRYLGFAGDEFGSICEDIRDTLRRQNDGRWEWEQIDYCFTGKDADLEPWGHQGIEIVKCDDDGIHCKAHIGKTFAGDEVCLNLQPEIEIDDEAWEKAREAYLDKAWEIVAGCAVAGEWTGDDWWMADAVDFTIPWETDDEPDMEALTTRIIGEAEKALSHFTVELSDCDEFLDVLAGWKAYDGDKLIECPEGKPGPMAAWMQ